MKKNDSQFVVRLPKDDLERFNEIVRRNATNRSELFRQWIRKYIEENGEEIEMVKEIMIEIKNGNDLELEEAIENQYGEEIPPATLYFYDGEWAISELNCFSSRRAGLGTCNCNSHPAFIERVITEEHAINIISEYIKNKKQG